MRYIYTGNLSFNGICQISSRKDVSTVCGQISDSNNKFISYMEILRLILFIMGIIFVLHICMTISSYCFARSVIDLLHPLVCTHFPSDANWGNVTVMDYKLLERELLAVKYDLTQL